jgi:hypothetical protein
MSVSRVVAIVALVSAQAAAQGNPADVEFKRAKELMAQGKYAEACAAFDKSQALEASVSVLINQANCREQNGQLATARELFLQAARQTDRATDARTMKLYSVAVERAAKLADRVSSLTIDVPETSRVPGLAIKRNGVVIAPLMWGSAALLDGGTYVIEASAPDYKSSTTTLTLALEKDRKTVTIQPLEAVAKPDATKPDTTQPDPTKPDPTKPDPTKPDPTKPDTTKPDTTKSDVVEPRLQPPRRRSRGLPIGLGITGIAMVAVSVGFEVWAGTTYSEAKLEGNNRLQDDLWQSANTKRYVAELTGIAGLATVGIAVFLFIRSGDDGPRVQPSVGSDQASLVVSGRF